MSATYLQMGCVESELGALQADFESLVPSTYKDGAYRLRRYSKFDFDEQAGIRVHEGASFVQNDNINTFQGNVVRTYDNLSQTVQSDPAFLNMCQTLAKTANLPNPCTLEAHQIRIIARPEMPIAQSAPEGIHQDGFDYVAIFTVARHNEQGADLLVWQSKDSPSPIATTTPKAGEYCIVNDKTLWHSATPISQIDKSDKAYWDLFVLTACHQSPCSQSSVV